MRVDARMFGFVPPALRNGLGKLPPVQRIRKQFLSDFGIPEAALEFINYPTKFDSRDAQRELQGSGVSCPRLEEYAGPVWDYWLRHLDPDLYVDRTLAGNVRGKVVLITGASSGIGKATALRLAETKAILLLVARTREKLEETQQIIQKSGGEAHVYPCDLNDMKAIDDCAAAVLRDFGHVDILINNAGRSIRRGVMESTTRFHDFERTMQLNYFGAVRMILALLPSMAHRRSGQIVNISSIGVLANAARFSAYVASKAALDAFSRCLSAEVKHKNIEVTAIYMPLVRTPMIAPTEVYRDAPALAPEEAAQFVVRAIIEQPARIATEVGMLGLGVQMAAPRMGQIIMNSAYRLSAGADAGTAPPGQASPELQALQHLLRGVHL